jgi:GntR family transcriptional regulator, transcriptional repressor for pyruvate dehydrogenase complex
MVTSDKSLQRTPISSQVSQALRDMILAGDLKPGDALPPERDLAELLQVSRPTVRQAISALAALNIVESRHGGGTFVTSLSPSLLAEPIDLILQVDPNSVGHLFEVRRAVEVTAAELAATRISEAGLDSLELIAATAGKVIEDIDAFIEQDRLLHLTIVSALGNPIYESLYMGLDKLSHESRKQTASDPSIRQQAHRDHLAIVKALSKRDPDAAAGAMRAHLDAVETAASGIAGNPASESEQQGLES